MADFIHSGWSFFIVSVTLLSIIACLLLAWNTSRAKVPDSHSQVGVGTTGHVWDEDLAELNNPLPRWWLYLFYITCVFGFLYLALYPGLGTYQGLLGWSSGNQYDNEIESAANTYDPLYEQFLAQDIKSVATNPKANEMGERLFLTYCSQCHGSTASGSRSFPNLADNDWLGAGDPQYIKNTIINGRIAVMPAMGTAIGGFWEVEAVANHVASLSGMPHDASLANQGAAKFAVCSGCHGAGGAGNASLGAPNLTDDIWLYEGSITAIKQAINFGLSNQMPAFGPVLGDAKAHVLAAYIWSLSDSAEAKSQD